MALIEVRWRANARLDGAGRIVDDDNRKRNVRPERRSKRASALPREVFQSLLQGRVDGEPNFAGSGRLGNRPIRCKRREHRHRQTARWHRFGFGKRDLISRHRSGLGKPIENAIARCPRRRGGTIGPSQLRRLRKGNKQCCFAERQPARFLAEIGERRSADTLDVAAIGCDLEIER